VETKHGDDEISTTPRTPTGASSAARRLTSPPNDQPAQIADGNRAASCAAQSAGSIDSPEQAL
jgi:hypothetical protein